MTVDLGSWVDNPSLIRGGVLFGQQATANGFGPDPDLLILAEGPTKANRQVLLSHMPYGDVNPPADLSCEASMMDGSLLGHEAWPIINGFGFGAGTLNWPALGLAAWSNGSMDSQLDAWCTLLNTLPAKPALFRLFREMNTNGTIYGAAGASVVGGDGQHGQNETPTTFKAAWQYIFNYMTPRCPWLRLVFCPANNGNVDNYSVYYPGDPYVAKNGVDAYVGNTPNIAQNLTTWYAAFNPTTGTTSRLPIGVCETQVSINAAQRPADFQLYPDAFSTAMPLVQFVLFWDAYTDFIDTSIYIVNDMPTGSLAAYQAVVGSSPFNGVPRAFDLRAAGSALVLA